MFKTKGKVDIKDRYFLTKHVCCPGDVMLKTSLFHFGNILWLFLKGDATSLLSIISINDLTGHDIVFTLLLSRKINTTIVYSIPENGSKPDLFAAAIEKSSPHLSPRR